MIEAEANEVAPSFVKSQGRIGIEIMPVSVWGSKRNRIRATFVAESGSEPPALGVVGTGTARWAAAAVRLACSRLEAGRQRVIDNMGMPVADASEIRQIVREARLDPLGQKALRIEPSESPAFYIADEPETHLHPAAVISVRDWLTTLAQTATTVLVATHNPTFLNGDTGLMTRILVLRDEQGTVLRTLAGGLCDELAGVREVLGLTQGDLLLMTRLALFVEGLHDQIVLDEWFGEELGIAGIRVFAARGVDNLPTLLESEIVAAFGIRIATLSDDTSVERAAHGRAVTRGEQAIASLLRGARLAGVDVRAIGLSRQDILLYLDDEICQDLAPSFPGWIAASKEQAQSGTQDNLKRWVNSKYGLRLTPDRIRSLAAECRIRGRVPHELTKAVRALTAYATNTD